MPKTYNKFDGRSPSLPNFFRSPPLTPYIMRIIYYAGHIYDPHIIMRCIGHGVFFNLSLVTVLFEQPI